MTEINYYINAVSGRPKSRWDDVDDVRNDLKKMKLTKWAEQVQDHSKWKNIFEKAKTIRVVATKKKKKKINAVYVCSIATP